MTSEPAISRNSPQVSPDAPRLRLSTGTAGGDVVTNEPVTLIGSRRDCHLPLPFPEVSKVHCAVVHTGQRLLVCDLKSRTSTFLNNNVVQTAELRPGDALRVGPVSLTCSSAKEGPSSTPHANAAPLALLRGDRRMDIAGDLAIIGRRGNCDIAIDTPDVSLAHALLFRMNGRPAISDLGSRSGTLLNGERVTCAWLANGDRLEIGGEKLVIEWSQPEPDLEDRILAADVIPALRGASAGELDDVEHAILALQQRITNSRGKLDERAAELAQREQKFAAEQEDFEQRRKGQAAAQREAQQQREEAQRLKAEAAATSRAAKEQAAALEKRQAEFAAAQSQWQKQQDELTAERRKLTQARDELAAQEKAQRAAEARLSQEQNELRAARTELDRQKKEIEQRRADVDRRTGEFSKVEAGLRESQAALTQRESALKTGEVSLQRQQQALQERDAELTKRGADIQQREEALRQQEAAGSEAARRIEQFKQLVQNAAEKFGGEALVDGAKGGPSARGKAKFVTSPNFAAQASAAEAPAAKPQAEPLPAPMVEEPIFQANGKNPAQTLPPELQERFKVLRRVSKASDAELAAQVLAEAAQRAQQPPPEPPRRKQRWWN